MFIKEKGFKQSYVVCVKKRTRKTGNPGLKKYRLITVVPSFGKQGIRQK